MILYGYILAAGALIRGYGAYREGLDQARLLEQNAKELIRNAKLVQRQGLVESKEILKAGEQDQARIVNATRSAGFTMYGSPLALYTAQVQSDVLNSRNALTTARLKADAMIRRAKFLRAQASSSRRGAVLSLVSGGLIAGSTFGGRGGGRNGGDEDIG